MEDLEQLLPSRTDYSSSVAFTGNTFIEHHEDQGLYKASFLFHHAHQVPLYVRNNLVLDSRYLRLQEHLATGEKKEAIRSRINRRNQWIRSISENESTLRQKTGSFKRFIEGAYTCGSIAENYRSAPPQIASVSVATTLTNMFKDLFRQEQQLISDDETSRAASTLAETYTSIATTLRDTYISMCEAAFDENRSYSFPKTTNTHRNLFEGFQPGSKLEQRSVYLESIARQPFHTALQQRADALDKTDEDLPIHTL